MKKKRGFYLYCIREKGCTGFASEGIDGESDTFMIHHDNLEAVVSGVSIEEFKSEEIERKSKTDLNWIKTKAQTHETVIEKAMVGDGKISAVIPMSFGNIFRSKKKIQQVLEKNYSNFRNILEELRGKQEWSLKVYLKDKNKFEQIVKEKNKNIKEKEQEIGSVDDGMAFFMEEELKELISKEMKRELNRFKNDLFEKLKQQSISANKEKILEKEVTGKNDPMILNTSYLISEENIDNFKKEAMRLNQKITLKGFYLEYSGPWPPYSFSNY
ncbi:MAG: GvpL/GvpF family gas vesicle protein [Candidatus Marinimicrobia bacterium]|nr:GvpL/GvpF family gas vesicle protein [Candidatus Neomarinimicrobiota bacterium]